jgi:hypothetical protein
MPNTIIVNDDSGNELSTWTLPEAWSFKNGFEMNPNNVSGRVIVELARRGAGHVGGNETASKFTTLVKNGKIAMTEKEAFFEKTWADYRAAMENDTWGLGGRVYTSADRTTVLFDRDAMKGAKDLLTNAKFESGPEQDGEVTFIDPADKIAYGLSEWTRRYLNSTLPGRDGFQTMGEYRKDLHMKEAQAQYAEEKRKADAKMERKVTVGTQI